MVTTLTGRDKKDNIEKKPQKLENFPPTLLVYIICVGMCGNGARMGGMKTI
jgi:hypothetical protein